MLKFLRNKNLVILTRVFLGFILFGAGMSKLYFDHAFPGIIGPVWLEDELTQYGLGFFARFVAFSQVIAGGLLLTQRFATLGAILSFPMLLCILMVTTSLEWQGTPSVNAVFIAMNIYLLIYDYHKLKFILTDTEHDRLMLKPVRKEPKKDYIFIAAFIVILSTIPFSFINLYIAWGVVAISMGLIIWNQLKKKSPTQGTS